MKIGNKQIKKRYIVIAILLLTLTLLYFFNAKVHYALLNTYIATYNRIIESRTKYELEYKIATTYDCNDKNKDDPVCILGGIENQQLYEDLYITDSGCVYSNIYDTLACYNPVFSQLTFEKKIDINKIDKIIKTEGSVCSITPLLLEEGIINENAVCTSK